MYIFDEIYGNVDVLDNTNEGVTLHNIYYYVCISSLNSSIQIHNIYCDRQQAGTAVLIRKQNTTDD